LEAINNFLLLLDSYLGSAAYFPYILLGVGIFFTLYLGFPQIRFFGHAWKVVTGKFDKKGALLYLKAPLSARRSVSLCCPCYNLAPNE